MIAKVIEKRDLPEFLKNLCGKNLHAPVRDELGNVNFELIKDPAEATLNYSNTLMSVKSLFLPQTEVIFELTGENIGVPDVKGGVVFGIRPCDARGLQVLKKVFEKDKISDSHFLTRENRFTKIGLACTNPGERCFCTSFGFGPFSGDGLDMLFADIGEKYFVECSGEKGAELIKENSKLFSEPTKRDVELRREAQRISEGRVAQEPKVKGVTEELGKSYDIPLWKEISEPCLGCGICAYLCPVCHCFDMTDEKVKEKTRRVRTWDTCMSSYFTVQASGHNPRPTKKERVRNRIYHKFKYLPESIGEFGCVGCARCIENCPAGVDVTEILSRVSK